MRTSPFFDRSPSEPLLVQTFAWFPGVGLGVWPVTHQQHGQARRDTIGFFQFFLRGTVFPRQKGKHHDSGLAHAASNLVSDRIDHVAAKCLPSPSLQHGPETPILFHRAAVSFSAWVVAKAAIALPSISFDSIFSWRFVWTKSTRTYFASDVVTHWLEAFHHIGPSGPGLCCCHCAFLSCSCFVVLLLLRESV